MENQIEVKILVAENKRHELYQIVEKLRELGLEVTREGGGNLPTFSGYYAVLVK